MRRLSQHSQRHPANSTTGNLAFLIRHNQASYGKQVEVNDVFVASRYFKGCKDNVKNENGKVSGAGLGVFVNGNGFTHTVVRIFVKDGDNALEILTAQVDELMAPFFPGT